MKYIWQHPQWPHFKYNLTNIQDMLYHYAIETVSLSDKLGCLPYNLKVDTTVNLMTSEAIKTSEIEGEKLNIQEVRSSLRNQLGLSKNSEPVNDPRAIGIAQLMIAVRGNYAQPLTKEELFAWHSMILPMPYKNLEVGKWRTGSEPMHIASGPVDRETVHFVAPPSTNLEYEMEQFISWFNATDPAKASQLPGPVRAAIAHLYFESIHPFDDGNGRIGRAIAEKALSQELKKPIAFSLSTRIQKHKKEYYQELSLVSKADIDITRWIEYFVKTIHNALLDTQEHITMVVKQAQFWNDYGLQLNERQSKVLARMLNEEDGDFKGGITAQKYIKIAHCSKATATRDLQELLASGCIERLPAGGRSISYTIKLA
ncbi:Fic family protein [Candidatus Dependentiae bacterium]|nr:Fic family protein [Candidatus Dependentiae bacterium]